MGFFNKTLIKFYFSCFLSAWGDRLWAFALSIYFVTINKDSLLITAINGLTCTLAQILLGPLMGSFVDKYQRITVVRTALLIQNTSVAFNCLLIVILIINKQSAINTWGGSLFYIAQGFIIFINVISSLSSMIHKIAIEKDWVIVIAKSVYNYPKQLDQNQTDELMDENAQKDMKEAELGFKKQLTLVNSTMRRIDLSTSVIGPLVAGLIMSFLNFSAIFDGTVMSALFFSIWNVISFVLEYFILLAVYNEVPELKKSKLEAITARVKDHGCSKFLKMLKKTPKAWKTYMSQGLIVMPGLSLAILYLTVLSFDSITIGYAKYQQVTEMFISIMQGVGSISGVLGTIAFPILHNRVKMRLQYIGLIGAIYQISFLFVCFAAIWLPGSPFILANNLYSTKVYKCIIPDNNTSIYENSTMSGVLSNVTDLKNQTLTKFESVLYKSPCYDYTSIIVLLTGMALSRFGLWLTDLVINQTIQQTVSEDKRGIIGGVQGSLNEIFSLIKFVCVILLSDIPQYGYLVIISISAVFIAFCLYCTYALILIFGKGYKEVPQKEPENLSPIDKNTIKLIVDAEDSQKAETGPAPSYVNNDPDPRYVNQDYNPFEENPFEEDDENIDNKSLKK